MAGNPPETDEAPRPKPADTGRLAALRDLKVASMAALSCLVLLVVWGGVLPYLVSERSDWKAFLGFALTVVSLVLATTYLWRWILHGKYPRA